MAVQIQVSAQQRMAIAKSATEELMDALLNTYLADSFPVDRLEAQIIEAVFTLTNAAIPLKGAIHE